MSIGKEWGLTLSIIVIALLVFSTVSPCFAEEGVDLQSVISELMSNPIVLASFAVKFCLGLLLGYFSAKVLKYILALVAIVLIGLLLDIWQLGGLGEFFSKMGIDWQKTYSLIQTIISVLGILTILPIAVGFLIGVIIAVKR
ncbi:hypothetical protein KEJ27_01680 [Candidatus Bathyarchaeota archaeon]|nr:hypothetical protein [Candidatus Bathyarchaeota archaeon]MBS7613380.1 hypothetical protein [Candidatus Bathyarchaeota archaeon]MBS7618566.1 hypothetical protein [Candidatus Bathyarchaeota archaeon]